MKLIRFVTLILISSLIAGCNETDPDKPVTQNTFDQAIKKFEKSEQEKINALGGESYFEGKTINEVKKSLDRDYLEKQKGELIEHVKAFKAQNLVSNQQGTLDLEQVQTLFARNDNERQTEVNETKAHQKYLDAVINAEKKQDPLGFVTGARTITPCVTPELACAVTNLKSDPTAYNREVKKRVASNECQQLIAPKNRKSGLRYEILEVITYKRQVVYKTPVGWIAPSDVVGKSSPEELETLKDIQELEIKKLEMPPPQFYTIFRPLLNISPANPSRIELAEKAIAINAKNKGLPWDDAAKDFVLEQQDLSRAEYACLKDKSCDKLDALARTMAGYILAPDLKTGSEVKPLPCEILAVSDCKFATSEAKRDAEEAEKQAQKRVRRRK